MSTKTVSRMAIQETYEDVEEKIKITVHRFRKVQPSVIEKEDAFQIANLYFLIAYSAYKEDKDTSFQTYVKKRVEWGLQDQVRQSARRHRLLKRSDLLVDPKEENRSSFNLNEFLNGLGQDARQVVEILLDPPMDVEFTLRCKKSRTRKTIREAMSEFLQDMGWTAVRVTKSFQEVAEALTSY